MSVNARLNVNVALNRPSYQVSTRTDDGVNQARYANDGDHNTAMLACAHTLLATNPWWAVDLGVALYVVGVKFTNRGDCCGTYAAGIGPRGLSSNSRSARGQKNVALDLALNSKRSGLCLGLDALVSSHL